MSRRFLSLLKRNIADFGNAERRQDASTPDRDNSEGQYRNFFEHMLDGVYLCADDGTILAANPAMVRMLGYESEAELCEFENAFDMCRQSDQRTEITRKLAECGEARDVVTEVMRKNGSARTVLTNVKVLSGDPGHGVIYQGSISDVSELRAQAIALRDSEEHFRTVAENSLDIISVIDESGDTKYSSPACEGITGHVQEDFTGQSFYKHVHADDVGKVRSAVTESFASPGSARLFSYRYRHANGSEIYLESICNAYRDPNGKLRGVVSSRNLSDRRRTSRQMQQAQKLQAIGELTGGIAHDFNNLLTIIVGNLQCIEEVSLDPEVAVHVETALRAARDGADLTRRLLAFALSQPLEPKVTRICKLVADFEPLLCRSLGSPMAIQLQCDEGLWFAKVDPTQLESAILNLAINARDAMDGKGELSIRLSNRVVSQDELDEIHVAAAGEYVCIEVEDTGIGMTEEMCKSAIDPFFSTKEMGNGSGLGLSSVYGFARQSGGWMNLESEYGQGTKVQLYLPRSLEQESRNTESDVDGDLPRGQETVLVVDDNADVRNSAVAMVSRMGYEVLSAANGPEALTVLASSDVKLLFSDVRMPQMSGFELAARAQAANPELRVLLTSGYTDTSTPVSDDERELFEYIPKPYDKQDLALRFRRILNEKVHE